MVKMDSVLDAESQLFIDKLAHEEESRKLVEDQNNSLPPKPPQPSSNNANQSNEDTGHTAESCVSKRRKTSVVWNHFDEVFLSSGKVKAVCKSCKKELSGGSNAGTRHLHDHIKSCLIKKTNDIKQAMLKGSRKSDGTLVLTTGPSFDQEDSRQKFVKMIAMHEFPFRITEYVGFRDFVTSLQPNFKMPSRNTVRSDIMKMYEQEKKKIIQMFEKNQTRIAITTDMWTSNQDKGFMAITSHYIDEEWNIQSRIIRFVYVETPHTAEALSNVLIETLMDWNLDCKLSTLTVDNCSTNDALINLLLGRLSTKKLMLGGTLLHMRCCAHILNLIVKEGLKFSGESIQKIRDSVSFWTAGPKRVEKFEDVLNQLKIPYTKKLARDVSTRWNSTYLMLESALPYKDAFERLNLRDSQYKCLPSAEEWELAEEMHDKLELFYSVTKIFSGTQYPTSNLFFPSMCDIKMSLNKWTTSGSQKFVTMALKMSEKFDKYWDEIHGILGIAIILDPRFKMCLVEYYFPLMYSKEVSDEKIKRIKDICYDLVVEYATRSREARSNKSNLSSSTSGSQSTQSQLALVLSKNSQMNNFASFMASRVPHKGKTAVSELDYYLEEEVTPITDDFDILAWWSEAHKYPTLKSIAKDILAVPISTVASESAFSTSGRVISEHRSKLQTDTIEALMCIQNWIWGQRKDARMCEQILAQYCDLLDDEDGDDVVSTGNCIKGSISTPNEQQSM